jgi:hypothetical protein
MHLRVIHRAMDGSQQPPFSNFSPIDLHSSLIMSSSDAASPWFISINTATAEELNSLLARQEAMRNSNNDNEPVNSVSKNVIDTACDDLIYSCSNLNICKLSHEFKQNKELLQTVAIEKKKYYDKIENVKKAKIDLLDVIKNVKDIMFINNHDASVEITKCDEYIRPIADQIDNIQNRLQGSADEADIKYEILMRTHKATIDVLKILKDECIETKDTETSICPICYEKPINVAMSKCGHTLCLMCSKKITNHLCPVCREYGNVIKLYFS